MITRLLFTFSLSLFLFINVGSAQIDEDGTTLIGVSVDCNNADLSVFESDIGIILNAYTWTENPPGACNGNITVDDYTVDVGPAPFDCDGEVDVEVDLDCDGNIVTIDVVIDIVDLDIPYDFNNDPFGTLFDPTDSSDCDLASTDNDLSAWIAGIENNDFGGDPVFGDNCSDGANLTIAVTNDPTPLDYTTCVAMVYDIEFDVTDECGNLETFTFQYEVLDNDGPEWDSALDDEEVECGVGSGDPQGDFQNWADDILQNVNNWAEDVCNGFDVIITWDGPYTVDLTTCNGGDVWDQDVTFIATDQCGEETPITVNYKVVDTEDPYLAAGPIPAEDIECEGQLGLDHNAEFQLWADNIVGAPDTWFTDDCTEDVDLIVTYDPASISPNFGDCDDDPFILDETVTFTVEDACGNTFEHDVQYTILDTRPPAIDVSTSGTTYSCTDFSGIMLELENILLNQTTDDCSDPPTSLSEFTITPDPTDETTWTYIANTACEGVYEFFVDYTDPCMGGTATETVTIDVEDLLPPVLAPDPSGELPPLNLGAVGCDATMIPFPEIWVEDDCDGLFEWEDPPIINLPVNCDDPGTLQYDLEDNCGNIVSPPLEIEFFLEPQMPLTSLADTECDVDFALTVGECELLGDEYIFDSCPDFQDDPINPTCQWSGFPFLDGWFEGGCEPYNVMINPPYGPCPVIVEADWLADPITLDAIPIPINTQVVWTVIDACGDVLEWSFDIIIECINCPPGSGCDSGANLVNPCLKCDDANPQINPGASCWECDATVLNGFCSCTPPGNTSVPPCYFNNPLCDDGFVPNNMSWFSFTAGATEIEVEVFDVDCIATGMGGTGVQTGIYSECSLGNCLASDNNCGNLNAKSFSLTGLTVGNTYYIYVDGCAGAGCTFEISVTGQVAFLLDEPQAITINACGEQLNDECENDTPTEVCPGQEIVLLPTHDGSSPTEQPDPYNDECGFYDPGLKAVYIWSFDPPFDDFGALESWNSDPDEDGFSIPPFTPSTPGMYTICLEQVVTDCDVTDEVACITLNVAPKPPEQATFRVCRRDLEQLPGGNFPNGWDPNADNSWVDAPGTTGVLPWQGGEITLDMYNTTFDANGCFLFIGKDNCDCDIEQTICIELAGTPCEEAQIYEMFMFDCQFYEFDNDEYDEMDYFPYHWEWSMDDDDDNDPFLEYDADGTMCERIEFSADVFGDWGAQDLCDTIVKPLIRIVHIDSTLVPGDCTPQGTPWTFGICLDGICDDYDIDNDWPEIDLNYDVVWVDCETGNPIFTGETYTATTDQTICAKATYYFNDGAWGGDDPFNGGPFVPTMCDWIYGPMMITSATPPAAPIVMGATFCETDLAGHDFTITNNQPGDTYTWTGPAGTNITPSADGVMATIDFPTGMSSVTITVEAVGDCGNSTGTFVVNFTESPRVTIGQVAATCLGDNVTLTASASGGTGPYTYVWDPAVPDATTATYATTDVGVTDVTVEVTDANGCKSLIGAGSFEVVPPLAETSVTCGSITQTSVGFIWESVLGATGYDVSWTGAQTGSLSGTQDLMVDIPGLTIDQTVTITVTPLGPAPCGNANPITFSCTTSNCPDPDYDFDPDAVRFCINDIPQGFSFQDFVSSNDDGNLVFDDPAGGVDASGNFDPSAYTTPGSYDITTNYLYSLNVNPPCERPGRTITIIVDPVPSADFTITPEICIDGTFSVDQTSINGDPAFDFGEAGVSLANPSFNSPGMKTVDVVVTSAAGCISTSTQMVNVLDTLEQIVFLTCQNDINFVEFFWEAVDGSTEYTFTWTSSEGGSDAGSTGTDTNLRVDNLIQGEDVTLEVTAIADQGFCADISATLTCTAGNCDPIPAPMPACAMEGEDSVQFAWDPVPGITEYIVSYDGNDIVTSDLFFDIADLCPGVDVRIRVASMNPIPDCPNSNAALSDVCVTDPCPPLTGLEGVPVTDGSIDKVQFQWDQTPGATEYLLSYTIDGGADMPEPSQTDTYWELTGLDAGVIVKLTVTPVFGACGPCLPVCAQYPAGQCPEVEFLNPDPILTFCWDGVSTITLTEATPVDIVTQVPFTGGEFIWSDPRVGRTSGVFIPDSDTQSMTYTIEYTWTDDVSNCPFANVMEVRINIQPVAAIPDVPPLCEGETASIQAVPLADDAATYAWEFEGGDLMTATEAGPHDVTFSEGRSAPYVVQLTVSSASDCQDVVTTNITVDEQLDPLVIDCGAFSNNSVTFEWNDIDGIFVYNYSVVDASGAEVASGIAFDSEFFLGNLTPDEPYTITVEADGQNACPPVTATLPCAPSSCPPSEFDPNEAYDFLAGCPEDFATIMLPGADEYLQDAPNENIDTETWTAVDMAYDGAINSATGAFDPSAVPAEDLPVTIDINYEVVYEGEGCTYSTTFTVELYQAPVATASPETVDCIKDEVPTIEVFAQGGDGNYTYYIGNSPPDVTTVAVYPVTAPGLYPITVEDGNGCTTTTEVMVRPAENPMVTITGETIVFNGDTGVFEYELTGTAEPVTDVIWYLNGVPIDIGADQDEVEILAAIADLGTSFELSVDVFFAPNCFEPADIRVEIIDTEKIFVPNVISPGLTDGENNRWRMYTKGSVRVTDYSIYDRWGELVYTRELDQMVDAVPDPNGTATEWRLDWYGDWGSSDNLNQGQAEQGVYVYVINYIIDEGTPGQFSDFAAGDLTIFR